jgi:hypothetical protein
MMYSMYLINKGNQEDLDFMSVTEAFDLFVSYAATSYR